MHTMSRDRRVDWARLIDNLRRAGMDMRDIVAEAGIPKATLYGYINEDLPAEPAFWAGYRLLSLWVERTGCRWSDVPMRAVQPSVSRVLAGL